MRSLPIAALVAIFLAAVGFSQAPKSVGAGPEAAIVAFHSALQSGDAASAMKLIAADALFIEGGNLENRTEYESNHLPADIDFEKAIHSKYKTVRVTVKGSTAWVISESDSQGTFEGRPVDFAGMELAVLTREPAGWRIRSMHWSSRKR
jgi:ketosteroid isomerase-like protein